MESIGEHKGATCNRDGCNGIIDEHERDQGCSCHINPPCSSCTTNYEYCPECDWSAEEDKDEYMKKYYKNTKPSSFKRRTLDDLDGTKVDWIISSSWHSGMEISGVYPENLSFEEVKKELRSGGVPFDKVSMGKFKRFGNGKFTYSYFTD